MTETLTRPGRAAAAAAAAGLLALLVASLTLIWPGPADSAPLRSVVLGSRVATVPADCPGTDRKGCQTLGRVTGFQAEAGNSPGKPYAAPFDGKLVSWSITLSRPSNTEGDDSIDEVGFFNDYFGRPSQARITVLRRIPQARPPEFRMVRQSPIQILNPYFGSTVEFALEHPLTVLEDQVVALTVPTWAPAFFHSAACEEIAPGVFRDASQCEAFSDENSWRASRRKGRCQFDSSDPDKLRAQVNQSHPQQKVGSEKQYGCYYEAARLLYTATIVKKPTATR